MKSVVRFSRSKGVRGREIDQRTERIYGNPCMTLSKVWERSKHFCDECMSFGVTRQEHRSSSLISILRKWMT
ncbi:unnamed protein product [Larinioides sclopetarius]|uniref:Uncharacterized protein n=1 Tax=Larinioides sclopetarius TaxID=280406 RepID=A0AAV2AUS2_9ARAC